MGFLASLSPSDNLCNIPHRRALELNGIISHANYLTDTRYATIGATTTASSTVAPRVEGLVPFDTPDKV